VQGEKRRGREKGEGGKEKGKKVNDLSVVVDCLRRHDRAAYRFEQTLDPGSSSADKKGEERGEEGKEERKKKKPSFLRTFFLPIPGLPRIAAARIESDAGRRTARGGGEGKKKEKKKSSARFTPFYSRVLLEDTAMAAPDKKGRK